MENEFNLADEDRAMLSSVQIELLEELLVPDDAPYPWDPSDPATEAFFAAQDRQDLLEGLSTDEIANCRQKFFTQIEQIWATTPVTELSVGDRVAEIQVKLQQRFAWRIPASWLEEIAHKATQVVVYHASMADKLVHCVQDLLPSWTADDLLVLARPYAYAMRSSEADRMESVVAKVQAEDWTTLPEIERARVSLAIAQYTLSQLQNNKSSES